MNEIIRDSLDSVEIISLPLTTDDAAAAAAAAIE
jgi:hypothetical protein